MPSPFAAGFCECHSPGFPSQGNTRASYSERVASINRAAYFAGSHPTARASPPRMGTRSYEKLWLAWSHECCRPARTATGLRTVYPGR
eukprot:scaffold1707_cov357-Prasinococcus_capsulatus_cf.AAC.19